MTSDSRRSIPDTAIDPDKLYRSDELSARMGWRPSGWRAAKAAGLRATRYGKRFFVLGRDVIEFIERQPDHG